MQNNTSVADLPLGRGIKTLLRERDVIQQEIRDAHRRLESDPSHQNIQTLSDMLTDLTEVQNSLTVFPPHEKVHVQAMLTLDRGSATLMTAALHHHAMRSVVTMDRSVTQAWLWTQIAPNARRRHSEFE